jgi:hypothetical protein
MSNRLTAVALILSLTPCCRSAVATTVDFTFTGVGANGSLASGAFSIDDAALQPAYYGQISQFSAIFNFSLTVSNIPGGGPSSVSLDPQGSSVFFGLDSGGIGRIIPGGSFIYPNSYFYQLTANTNFFAPPYTPDYHSVLEFVSFSRVQTDDITWSPAVAAVPEPASGAVLAFGGAIVVAFFRRQAGRRTQR